jgi:sigma-B regulation protein RsbU (phosphoserine phosphatase)
MVLGAFEHIDFEETSTELLSGDRLLLFTDGITEARTADDREFGDEGLLEVLTRQRDVVDARGLVDAVFAGATEFARGEFQDDATVLAMAIE